MAHTYNVVILGNSGSGKSTLVNRVCSGEYTHTYIHPSGMVSHTYNVNVYSTQAKQNTSVCLNLYEHANMEHYCSADAALLCVNSTENHHQRLNELRESVSDFSEVHKTTPIVLVSTKVDVVGAKPITNTELSRAHIVVTKHILVSARTSYHIFEPLQALIRILLDDDTLFVCENNTKL